MRGNKIRQERIDYSVTEDEGVFSRYSQNFTTTVVKEGQIVGIEQCLSNVKECVHKGKDLQDTYHSWKYQLNPMQKLVLIKGNSEKLEKPSSSSSVVIIIRKKL